MHRVAIVGAGMIANAGHIPAWKAESNRAEIVAVCSRSGEHARSTAARHGIARSYDDVGVMLERDRPDIVSVCTPNVAHRAVAEAALRAGAHVLCEKPVAANLDDATKMYATADKSDRTLFVSQSARFSNRARAARELVTADTLGQIYYAEVSLLRRRGVPTWGQFHIREHSGGGVLLDLGVHALDLVLWLMRGSKPIAASGATFNKLTDGEDLVTTPAASGAPAGLFEPRSYTKGELDVEEMAVGMIRLAGGGVIVLRVSWAANVPSDGVMSTIILGTKAGMSLNPLRVFGAVGRYPADLIPDVPAEPDIPFAGHRSMVTNVLDALEGKAEAVVRRGEVLSVMATLDGLYRSARVGREMTLTDPLSMDP